MIVVSDELEDNAVYKKWFAQAKESIQELWDEKYDRYVSSEGLPKRLAEQKAHMKTLWMMKCFFFDTYKTFLTSLILLRDNEMHQEIMNDVDEKMDKDLTIGTALKRVMLKHQSKFNGLFEQDGDSSETEDTDDSENEEDDEIAAKRMKLH